MIADLLFAALATHENICLVDRAETDRILREQALMAMLPSTPEFSARVGAFTGAKLLVTGTILVAGSERYLVGKVLCAETGAMAGETVHAAATAPLGPLTAELAAKLAAVIRTRGPDLVGHEKPTVERAAVLRAAVGASPRPMLVIRIEVPAPDPLAGDTSADTEMKRFALDAGFNLWTNAVAVASPQAVWIEGRGTTAPAGRQGDLKVVRVRLDVRAVDSATGNTLTVEGQTSLDADLTETAAARRAFQNAAVALAERLLPRIVKP
jgi:hypothetical protein